MSILARMSWIMSDFAPVSHSAPVQVWRTEGQLWCVSEGGEEVSVRLVQYGGSLYPAPALPHVQPLHQPLAAPRQHQRQVYQSSNHRGASHKHFCLCVLSTGLWFDLFCANICYSIVQVGLVWAVCFLKVIFHKKYQKYLCDVFSKQVFKWTLLYLQGFKAPSHKGSMKRYWLLYLYKSTSQP